MHKFIVALIVVIIILLYFYQASAVAIPSDLKQIGNVRYTDYDTGRPGPKICFLGSVHGNESAGSNTLNYLIKTGWFERYLRNRIGLVRVIADGNVWGLRYGLRYQNSLLHPDINRNFYADTTDTTAQTILQLMQNSDLIVDFHEGWGFHLINPESMGSTISPGNTGISRAIAEKMLVVNNFIVEPHKKFVILQNHSCTIKTTLACYMQQRGKNYILIETSGQNNIQPITTRMMQNIIFVKSALDYMYQVVPNKI